MVSLLFVGYWMRNVIAHRILFLHLDSYGDRILFNIFLPYFLLIYTSMWTLICRINHLELNKRCETFQQTAASEVAGG